MSPLKDPEEYRLYMREYRRRRRAMMEKNFGISGEEEPKPEPEYPEYKGYREAFQPHQERIISDKVLNPPSMHKGNADNPQAYGEKGTVICPIHGCPLDAKGRCPICNPDQSSMEVDYQRALSNSDQEMNVEQYGREPQQSGDKVDDWIRSHSG